MKYYNKAKKRWDLLLKNVEKTFKLDLQKQLDSLKHRDTFNDWIYPGYTEGRYYHTLRHIIYMLDNIHDFKLSKKDEYKLELAIWFHDIVYDSTRTDNEKLSANNFKSFGNIIGLKNKHIKEICNLILVTKHNDTVKTESEKIICDLDLREFTSIRSKLNSEEVRKEFVHLSDEEFYKGRADFLRKMINKKYIYSTDLYRNSLEELAKHRITIELDIIRQMKF